MNNNISTLVYDKVRLFSSLIKDVQEGKTTRQTAEQIMISELWDLAYQAK